MFIINLQRCTTAQHSVHSARDHLVSESRVIKVASQDIHVALRSEALDAFESQPTECRRIGGSMIVQRQDAAHTFVVAAVLSECDFVADRRTHPQPTPANVPRKI